MAAALFRAPSQVTWCRARELQDGHLPPLGSARAQIPQARGIRARRVRLVPGPFFLAQVQGFFAESPASTRNRQHRRRGPPAGRGPKSRGRTRRPLRVRVGSVEAASFPLPAAAASLMAMKSAAAARGGCGCGCGGPFASEPPASPQLRVLRVRVSDTPSSDSRRGPRVGPTAGPHPQPGPLELHVFQSRTRTLPRALAGGRRGRLARSRRRRAAREAAAAARTPTPPRDEDPAGPAGILPRLPA